MSTKPLDPRRPVFNKWVAAIDGYPTLFVVVDISKAVLGPRADEPLAPLTTRGHGDGDHH